MRATRTRARLSDWPTRLAAVEADPTDEALQRLCAVLDLADADVVRRWDEPGHDQRRARLASMRAEARRANRLVAEDRAAHASAAAAKRAKDRPVGAAAGLAVVGGAAAR